MYNVNHKFALKVGGFNRVDADTRLKDHTMRDIARPNNDTLYAGVVLDLRADAMVLDLPAFESDYVSLMITGYDHYVQIPMSTRQGDFGEPAKLLVYSARTAGHDGGKVEGIDRALEVESDFVLAVVRAMPHANEPKRFERITAQMKEIRAVSLAEFMGGTPRTAPEIDLPDIGATDFDVFGNNLLEVLQFTFDHTTFDPKDPIDRELLAKFAPLGVVPGRPFDRAKAERFDLSGIRAVAERFAEQQLARMQDPENVERVRFALFRTKGDISLDELALQSVTGPIGMPAEEAVYLPVTTTDGKPMNAKYDYVVRMAADELPPAGAFWSITLYEERTGFFVPNDRKKYSVGKNAGMKLDADGGIEIHVAAEQPRGVPLENWLPIEREDVEIGFILRIYDPDLDVIRSGEWTVPVVQETEWAGVGN
jgi:hypothetical protein